MYSRNLLKTDHFGWISDILLPFSRRTHRVDVYKRQVYEVSDENSKEELQTILTKEDYEEIMAAGKIRVRFKYFEGLAK